ncbi:MAG: queuosine precursor transporter [Bacteroidales bacterium]|nr:queuosine precursor transporter [Bacteroidales bacterium]
MRQKVSVLFMLLAVVFVVCLITANLLETKVLDFFGITTITAGMLVFPISYIINDCIAEVWGFKRASLVIWIAFAMNFFVVAIGLFAVHLPSASFWNAAEHFNFIFGFAPRIVVASLLAFLSGSFVNAYIMSKMKILHKGKFFSFRAIASTIAGETIDSIIFFPIAFGGIITFGDLLVLMITQIILKSMYEVIVLPITIKVVKTLKRIEGTDVYDNGISYNIWKLNDK